VALARVRQQYQVPAGDDGFCLGALAGRGHGRACGAGLTTVATAHKVSWSSVWHGIDY
jgi:hypothetical protein